METYAVRGKILRGTALVPGIVVVRDGSIDQILPPGRIPPQAEPIIDAPIVAPGLIDLQVNGGFGYVASSDPEGLRALACRLRERGVTAFLPTIVTSEAARYKGLDEAFEAVRDTPGARILGFHLEGPFLSPRKCGAHDPALIEAADEPLFQRLLALDSMRLMTIAPEMPRALVRIALLRERGVTVSLGHTNASIDEFRQGIEAGATMATHLYNAMSQFHHREPGVAGASLTDDRVAVGLIVDGIHSHPVSVDLAVRAKGPEKIALVSDMMAATGMPDGTYPLGGKMVQVRGREARLPDGTLAGAVLTMDEAIRNLVEWGTSTPGEALFMATTVPASILGLTHIGRIESGCDADLTLFDQNLRVTATIVRGEIAPTTGESIDVPNA